MPKIMCGLLYIYLHPPLEVDEVNGVSWQIVTGIDYEGYVWHFLKDTSKNMTTLIFCYVSFGFAGIA